MKKSQRKKIIFLGERQISGICLQILLSEPFSKVFELVAISTNENFYKGAILANILHPDVVHISNSNRNIEQIENVIKMYNVDYIISVQHIWILPKSTLSLVSGNAFNLHNGKLPEYKGYNSISHAILNNDKYFYSTIHWMHEQVDTGDIIIEAKLPISNLDTAYGLYTRSLKEIKTIFHQFLVQLKNNNCNRKKIYQKQGHFYKREDLDMSKNLSAKEKTFLCSAIIRASYFPGYEPAYIYNNNKKFYLLPQTFRHEDKTFANLTEWELN